MRCDNGRGVWREIHTQHEGITIYRENRCKRKATRWVGGNLGLRKECGYCLRGWKKWLFEVYYFPDDPAEWLFKEYESKKDVELNPENHVCTWSIIKKEEMR